MTQFMNRIPTGLLPLVNRIVSGVINGLHLCKDFQVNKRSHEGFRHTSDFNSKFQ
jgi:hypothetical protein